MRSFILMSLALAASGCAGGAPPAWTGSQRITVNFKEVDVMTALDLVARSSDLQLLLDTGLKGTVTLTLHDTPARVVLNEVVRICDLRLTTHPSGILRVSAP